MSALAKNNIEEFIVGRGSVAYPVICSQFELVSKKVVDDALFALVEETRIVRGMKGGEAVYAPRRMKVKLTAIERDAEPVIEPAVDEPVAPPAPKLTCRERIIAVTEGISHAFTLHDVYEALPDLSENGVRTVFSRMCHGGNREFVPRGDGTYVTASIAARDDRARKGKRSWTVDRPTNIQNARTALADGPLSFDALLLRLSGRDRGKTIHDLTALNIIEMAGDGLYQLGAAMSPGDPEDPVMPEITTEEHPGTAMLAEVYSTRPERSDELSACADSLTPDTPSAEASFSLHRAGLHIEISGDALAVIQSVAGIQQALEGRA